MTLHTVVHPQLLLLQNNLLGAELIGLLREVPQLLLLLDQGSLVRYPLLLYLHLLVLHLIDLLAEIALFGLHRARVFIFSVLGEFRPLLIQVVYNVLLLVDPDVSLLDIIFELLDLLFLVIEFPIQVIKLLLEQLVLILGVKVVDPDSRDFIVDAFDFHFFVGDVFIGVSGLFDQVRGALLDGFLLGGMIHDVTPQRFGLCVQLHNALLEDLHLLIHVRLLQVHPRALIVSGSKRRLQHHILLLETLLFVFDLIFALSEEVLLSLALV
mmetsp:Transcript_42164/g.40401  ORF Transcript_42164/g.40401 Transcript_42164/m.40401 type:complete len:268 (-) Transcript_42164:993-1796(-)